MAAWDLSMMPSSSVTSLQPMATRMALLEEMLRLEPVVGALYRRAERELDLEGEGGPILVLVKVDVRAANTDRAAAGACPFEIDADRDVRASRASDSLIVVPAPLQETAIFLDRLLRVPNIRLVRRPTGGWNSLISSYELRGAVIATSFLHSTGVAEDRFHKLCRGETLPVPKLPLAAFRADLHAFPVLRPLLAPRERVAARGADLSRQIGLLAHLRHSVPDQAMPGMSGSDLAEAVRRDRPDLPIIIATGYGELPEGPAQAIPRLANLLRAGPCTRHRIDRPPIRQVDYVWRRARDAVRAITSRSLNASRDVRPGSFERGGTGCAI